MIRKITGPDDSTSLEPKLENQSRTFFYFPTSKYCSDLISLCVCDRAFVSPHQAREGVVHAVLQRAPLQDGEEGGMVTTARGHSHQVLHTLPQ